MKKLWGTLVVALLLTSPVYAAATIWGVSGTLSAAGAATDCASTPNTKAITLLMPTWATSADVSIAGTFVATYSFFSSTDGINYASSTGIASSTRFTSTGSTIPLGWAITDINLRYVCVAVTAFTSGTVTVMIEPRTGSPAAYLLASNGTGTAGAVTLGIAIRQNNANSSSVGLLVANAATLGVNSTPVVNTQASASVAAGAAGVQHIAANCSGSINTVAAQPAISLNLRNGATGAGTIVWSGVTTCALGASCALASPPLNIIGTAATAMTCEWSGIPAVGNFEVANLEYKNAN